MPSQVQIDLLVSALNRLKVALAEVTKRVDALEARVGINSS